MRNRKSLVAASVCLFLAGGASAEEELVWKIAFVSSGNRTGDEIYVMDHDGSHVTKLTENGYLDGAPQWSPDGTKIAFYSNRDGNEEIYVMGADGSNPTRLTVNDARDDDPQWSPDGSQIGFESDRDGKSDIFVMYADGSFPVNLTPNDANDYDLQWSPPDGMHIAFESGDASTGDHFPVREIYTMDAEGNDHTRLTAEGAWSDNPQWSPDGTQILFAATREVLDGEFESEIVRMDSDGGNRTSLSSNVSGLSGSPVWSPGGDRIAFIGVDSTDQGCWCLYVMGSDGSDPRKLTSDGVSTGARWSPDGTQISFAFFAGDTLEPPYDFHLYLINADGNHLRQLTSDSMGDAPVFWPPVWSPVMLPAPEPSLPLLTLGALMTLAGLRRLH